VHIDLELQPMVLIERQPHLRGDFASAWPPPEYLLQPADALGERALRRNRRERRLDNWDDAEVECAPLDFTRASTMGRLSFRRTLCRESR
jgi:hypothetical protein